MAIGPKTNELIDTYKLEIDNKRKNRKQVEETLKGYKVTDEEGNILAEIPDLNVAISNFDPSTKGLDSEVVRINSLIADQQTVINNIYIGATDVGCASYISDDTPVVVVIQDEVRGYNWSFSGDNPFVESNTIITNSNVGYGTYTGITTTGIGTYFAIKSSGTGDDDITDCSGYGTSISTIETTIASLRSQRDNIRTQVNRIKEDRAQYELQRYGYNNAISQIDQDIQEKEDAIATLQSSQNSQYFLE